MTKDLWTKCYEELCDQLKKEPTDRQIIDRMAEIVSHEMELAKNHMDNIPRMRVQSSDGSGRGEEW